MKTLGNVFILGDSYSTFRGYIPEGFSVYYGNLGEEKNDTDVEEVFQTWWYPLIEKSSSNLVLNSSFSGSTICNTGYDGKDYTTISFITRLENLINEGFFEKNKIDTFLLFGGTNDSWSDAPLGELMFEDWKTEDLYSVFPAMGYLFDLISKKIKGARVICLINEPIKQEVIDTLVFLSEKYSFEYIVLKNLDLRSDHPTMKGMSQINEQICEYLENN